jgi:hypothetical protein
MREHDPGQATMAEHDWCAAMGTHVFSELYGVARFDALSIAYCDKHALTRLHRKIVRQAQSVHKAEPRPWPCRDL